jgi:hypothetical protein
MTLRWSVGYALMRNLEFQIQGANADAKSNVRYNAIPYKYDYSSHHIFAGISYQL